MEAGLVFVSTNDLLGNIIKCILKQRFNLIGFYYYSNEKGFLQSHVFLIEIFRGKKIHMLGHNLSLDDLYSHQLVNAVALKKFKPLYNEWGSVDSIKTNLFFQNYKLSIFKALYNHVEIDNRTALYQLLNIPCDTVCTDSDSLIDVCSNTDSCINNANDLVNLVLKELDVYDRLEFTIPDYNTPTLSEIINGTFESVSKNNTRRNSHAKSNIDNNMSNLDQIFSNSGNRGTRENTRENSRNNSRANSRRNSVETSETTSNLNIIKNFQIYNFFYKMNTKNSLQLYNYLNENVYFTPVEHINLDSYKSHNSETYTNPDLYALYKISSLELENSQIFRNVFFSLFK